MQRVEKGSEGKVCGYAEGRERVLEKGSGGEVRDRGVVN